MSVAGECKECSTCERLIQTKTPIDVYAIPEKDENFSYRDKRDMDNVWTWTMTIVQATCYKLDRQSITNGSITSVDLYRPVLGQHILFLPVTNFQTIVRDKETCTFKRCDTVCTEFFKHSPGCGQQETRVENIFVEQKAGGITKYTTSVDTLHITHGPCTPCTTCSKGYFNEKCNVYADTHLPAGYCQPCKTECALDQFMYHSHGEGPCHNPGINYEAFPSGKNKWKIKEDYVCKKCPTWVLQAKAPLTAQTLFK
jgi:hypothetical protein